jgi:hypothetical protein
LLSPRVCGVCEFVASVSLSVYEVTESASLWSLRVCGVQGFVESLNLWSLLFCGVCGVFFESASLWSLQVC